MTSTMTTIVVEGATTIQTNCDLLKNIVLRGDNFTRGLPVIRNYLFLVIYFSHLDSLSPDKGPYE
jgi:hypothetical protein